MAKISLTAFFPAYNDQHTIEPIVRSVADEMRKVTNDFEVLVVNDGSLDKTGQILDRLRSELPFLRVIHHERNLGYGAALITGFKNAKKDLIFYTDGDGQYDVRELHNLLALMAPNIDLVNGYKVKRADAWYRIWIGECYRRLMRRIFRLNIRDVDCDFRLFRRRIFETISLESRSGVICVEMAKKFELAGISYGRNACPPLSAASRFQRILPDTAPDPYLQGTVENLVEPCPCAQTTPMDAYRGQKVLVTGGLGFIGSNLAIRLVELGASVLIVDSRDATCGANDFNIEPIKSEVEVVEGDSCNLDLMRRLVRGQNYIFNLAGHVSHIESMQDPFSDLHINTVGPLTLLEACKLENRAARVVYSSTRQVYGRPEVVPLVETFLLKPVDVNGVNKMAGEWYHMVYHQAYGIPTVALRLVNTYGPRQLVKHSRQGFLGWFVKQAIDGEEIQLFGDGQQLRGFNYIDDVINALLIAGVHPKTVGDYFNLGGLRPSTLEALVKILVRAAGHGSYRVVPFPPDKQAIDVGSVYSSWMKFHFATGWQPEVSLEEGLPKMVDYYKLHKAHYW